MAELTNPYTGGRLQVGDGDVDAWISRGFLPVKEETPVEAREEAPAPRRKRTRKTESDD